MFAKLRLSFGNCGLTSTALKGLARLLQLASVLTPVRTVETLVSKSRFSDTPVYWIEDLWRLWSIIFWRPPFLNYHIARCSAWFEIIQTQNWRTSNLNRKSHLKVTKLKSKFSLIILYPAQQYRFPSASCLSCLKRKSLVLNIIATNLFSDASGLNELNA